MMLEKNTIGIVGAGIAGLATALEFSKLDYKVVLFEKDQLLNRRTKEFTSFNYTINYRGKQWLKNYELWESVLQKAAPLQGKSIHLQRRTIIENYGHDDDAMLYSISRLDLLNIFSIKVNDENISIIDQCVINDVSINKKNVELFATQNAETKKYLFDFIVGADGANSFLRKRFNHHFHSSVEKFAWSYIDIQITEDERKNLQLSDDRIHIWPNQNYLGIGIPNLNSSISLLHTFGYVEGSNKVEILNKIKADIKRYAQKLSHLKLLNPDRLGVMLAVDAKKWFIDDKIIIIGDAAHGVYPFLGQGMNAALQDAELLSNLLRKHNRLNAFSTFQKIRKPELDIVRRQSLVHFSRLNSTRFVSLRKIVRQFDLALTKLTRNAWLEEYSALSNSTMRFDKVYKKIRMQKLLKITPFYFIPLLFYTAIILYRNALI